MTCERWETKIDAYVDGELAGEEERNFREHLASCAACSQATLGRMDLKRAVKSAGKRYQPSVEFRARMARRIAAPRPRAAAAWWRPVVVGLAVLLLAFTGHVFYVHNAQRQQVIREIADLHVTNLAGASPVDVVSSDQHTVKPWFQGKLPFTFDLPDLNGTQFELIGGRMVFVEQEPAALLVFGIRKHKVSVILSLDRDGLERLGSTETSVNSFHLESWSQRGLRYTVISDAESQDVHTLAELFRSTPRQ